jgi:hypothetical protein
MAQRSICHNLAEEVGMKDTFILFLSKQLGKLAPFRKVQNYEERRRKAWGGVRGNGSALK